MKKITVTIGIPTFNEEQNIKALLQSVINQKLKKSIVTEILVYSDASSDNTNKIVEQFSKTHSLIKLIQGKTRKGKYFRVNELFKRCKTEVLVILDADIALVGNDFLEKMIHLLTADPNALLVSAHNVPVVPNTFIGKVICTNFVLWESVAAEIPNYDSATSFHGSATAYRGSFARSVNIPTNLTDPHLYIYLLAKKRNGFRYCRNAEVLYYPITTISDLKKFLRRSIGKKDKILEKMFGEDLISRVHYLPTRSKFVGLWKCFLWQPFYTPLAVLLSLYIGKFMKIKEANKSPIWDITISSKRKLSYAK